MEWFTSNFSGKVKRITVNGREFLVAPLTLIVPGVLNGSRGALYYPPEEVSRNYSAWDGMPIVVNHPTTENGTTVSARSPYVMKNFEIGRVYNAKIDPATGSLTAEGWFDVQDTKRVDNRIYTWLRQGKSIELSTGLFTDNELARNGSRDPRTKREYKYIAKNYRPDHLAILPDQKGACSLDDGCGVLANAGGANCGIGPGGFQPGNTCAGGGGKVGGRSDSGKGLAAGLIRLAKKRAKQARRQGNTKLAEKYEAQVKKYESGDTGIRSTATTNAKRSKGKPKGAASSALDMTPDKACKIVKDGQVHGKPLTEKQRGMFGAKCGERGKVKNADSTSNSNGDTTMALNAKQRKAHISFLTTNCDCWKGEGDAEVLNEFDDDKLIALKKHAEEEAAKDSTVNSLKEGIKIGSLVLTVNAEGKMMMKDGEEECDVENGEECEGMMKKKYAKPATKNSAVDDDEDEDEDTKQARIAAEVKNYFKSLSPTEQMELLPAEVRNVVKNAIKVEKQAKAKIIARLTANVQDSDKKKILTTRLANKPLDELQDILDMIPATNRREEEDDDGSYFGAAGGGITHNRRTDNYGVDPDEDVLPVYNGSGEDEDEDSDE